VTRLTLPGKKPVDAKAFWNGLNGRKAYWTVGPQIPEGGEETAKIPGGAKPVEAKPVGATVGATGAAAVAGVGEKRAAGEGVSSDDAPPPKGFKWGGTY